VSEPKCVRVNGIELAYDEAGAGGRPFVLVHGFTGSRGDFTEQLPRLAAHGRTLAPDLRGHGASGHGPEAAYTFDQLAADVLGFLDALGIAGCDLLGHSMGGMVALRMVLARPERVASLVLMDTAAGPLDSRAAPFMELAAKIARENGMEALFAAARAIGEANPDLPAAVRRHVERVGAEAYWARSRAKLTAMDPVAFATLGPRLGEHASLAPRLGEIRCPTLVMVGDQDAPFLAAADELAEGIRGARQVVIPGAAHQPQLENPDAWRAAILDHLARARSGAA
jgi:2-succinyl-6-hydroxy-2,4-cyclohexadiene-1-carboxylate synthase